MEETQIKPSGPSDLTSLQEECESLRRLVSSLLLLLLLVSLTLTIFLARQWRFTKSQLELLAPQANQVVSESARTLPAMQDFVRKLNEYAKTHPDFAPIATKYHLNEVLATKPPPVPALTNK